MASSRANHSAIISNTATIMLFPSEKLAALASSIERIRVVKDLLGENDESDDIVIIISQK